MLQIYIGDGKGKTTAAIGAAIRAAGCGMKILFVQFLKNGDSSEVKVLKSIRNIEYLVSGEEYVLFQCPNVQRLAASYGAILKKIVSDSKRFDMIVLDEVLDTCHMGLINEDELSDFLVSFKDSHEIILTGHYLPESFRGIADYISLVSQIKHPFQNGACARKGIEY